MQNRKSGIMISETAFPNMPVLLKHAGLDFAVIDCEHGGYDYADVAAMVMNARLIGLEVLVRLADNSRKDIIKVMDMGADGVLLPMTNTPSDIRRVVEYAKYPPIGKRGISTMRAHTLYDPPAILDYLPQANARTKVFAQIETVAGVEHIDAVLAVEGVSGVLVGPNDLSADYGCLGNANAPQITQAVECVGAAAVRANKIAGIITANAAYLAKAKQCGFTYFCVGSELNAVADYCKQVTRKVNES